MVDTQCFLDKETVSIPTTIMQTPTNSQPTTVDDYLAALPLNIRTTLETLRQTIKKAAPDAEEIFTYQMPGFRYYGRFIWFAAFTNHYSLFVTPGVLAAFREEVKPYATTKSAVKFPLNQPVPVELVTNLVAHAVAVNRERAARKAGVKKS
jgi:uncharacterized protein YdhG (YjbR/CyaY superfamily)